MEATCEQYLTARVCFYCTFFFFFFFQFIKQNKTKQVIYGGSDPETIFKNLNAERFDGKLVEHHEMVVHGVFTKKMQSAILTVVNRIVDSRPTWILFNDKMIDVVTSEVRKSFLHLESESAYRSWLDKWGSLLETSLRTCLHGRVFSVSRQQYATITAEKTDVSFDDLTNKVMFEISQICPDFKSLRENKDYSQSNDVSCQISETRNFITTWILPVLIKHSGECKWSLERGLPIPLNEDDVEPVAACPTQ